MHILVWFALGFGASCAMGAYLFRGIGLWLVLGISAALGMTAVVFRKKWKVLKIPAILLAGLAAGSGVFLGYDAWYLEPVRRLDGQIMEIQVIADDFGRETDYGSAVDGTMTLDGRSYRIRLYLDETWSVTPGDEIRVPAQLRFTDEGGVSEPAYHRTNGILLLANQEDEGLLTEGEPRWYHQSAYLRRELKRIIDDCFPGDAAGFARALLLGDKSELNGEVELSFRLTGLSHMVAVSGLHVSVLFALVYRVTGKKRFLTALVGIPAVLLFAAVAGFTPSVTRAALMQILMMLALAWDREYDPPTALAFAVTVMLCIRPLVIASVGFQLSVGSVAGIYLFYRGIQGKLDAVLPKGKTKPGMWLRRILSSSAAVSLSASALITPLVAYYFGLVSLVSVVTNLLVIPVISLVFYGIMAVCLLGAWLPAAGMGMAWLISWLMRYVFAVANLFASFPLAAVYTGSIYILFWLIWCYGLGLWGMIAKPGRIWPLVCCGAAGLCCSLLLTWVEPMLSDYRVSALDVGQGQCILLQSRGTTFLVDCGGDQDEQAGDRAAEALLSMGITHLDGLIVTHYDRDHVGGIPRLAGRIGIERIYLPLTEDTDGMQDAVLTATRYAEQIWLDTDLELTIGNSRIRIFAPESGKSGNESCVAVLFQSEKYDTLITGDMSASGERELLDKGVIPDLELLIAGHHGSATSTSAELVYRAAPDVVIISVGADNAYGHPREEILYRLALYGCAVYRTDQMGDITFRG